MSPKREERSGASDSVLEGYKYKYYKELRDGRVKIRVSSKLFRCPYCREKKSTEYDYRDLLRHASRISRDSRSASFKDKAMHLGLVKYLERYVDTMGKSSRSNRRSTEPVESYRETNRKSSRSTMNTEPGETYQDTSKSSWSSGRTIEAADQYIEGKTLSQSTARTTEPMEDNTKAKGTSAQSSVRSTEMDPLSQSTTKLVEPSKRKSTEEPIVWPWMAIVANIPVEVKDGRHVGESGRNLKEKWASQGYNPVKVHPLWSFRGHSGYAIVEFNKDWAGLKNAMTFEKAFEMDNLGKRDWHAARNKGDRMYAWIARGEEYYSKGLIGEYLRKNGDLKTVSDVETEHKRKDTKLVSNLTNELEVKNKQCEEMKSKINKTERFMRNVMRQKEKMIQTYNEEMKKMQQKACDQLEKISIEHEKSKSRLEAQRRELKLREKELKEREALNESEKWKLNHEKKMNEKAILEQKKADEDMLKLAEDQKREKEKLHKKIIELEKQLDAKQRLELEIEQKKGAIEVMKHMSDDGDMEVKKKMALIEEELKEREEDLDSLEALQQALIVRELKSNDELQDARKELINGLKDSHGYIGVKRMGELDNKPFHIAAKRKYSDEEATEKAIEMCSLWEDYLRDPSWHPFKVITVGEKAKELINEDDEKLKSLKNDCGDEVYEAVMTALTEMNHYNPSGRYPLCELWSCKEGRKATLREGVEYILKQWKVYKRKKN